MVASKNSIFGSDITDKVCCSIKESHDFFLPRLIFWNIDLGKEINNQPDATCSSMPITTTSINLTCLSSSTNDTNLPTVQGYGIVIHELNSTVIEMGHIIGPFLELVLNLERYNFHKLVVYPIYTRQSYGCGFFSSLRRDVVYSQVINAEYFLTEFSSTTNSLIDGKFLLLNYLLNLERDSHIYPYESSAFIVLISGVFLEFINAEYIIHYF